METTRLVQRLEPPFKPFGQLRDNPFSFGGGYKNGGLSDEAMDLIREVFSFDYMGAAEFEFGALPKALSSIFENREKYRGYTNMIVVGPVYIICHQDDYTEISHRVGTLALSGDVDNDDIHLKAATHLNRVLFPEDDARWTPSTCGWLELNNGFFFFTNKEMFEGTLELFGIEVVE